jgi:hypothetical protein
MSGALSRQAGRDRPRNDHSPVTSIMNMTRSSLWVLPCMLLRSLQVELLQACEKVDVDANLFRGVLAAHRSDVQLDTDARRHSFVTAVTWRRFGMTG